MIENCNVRKNEDSMISQLVKRIQNKDFDIDFDLLTLIEKDAMKKSVDILLQKLEKCFGV